MPLEQADKRQFVIDLCDSIRDGILADIDAEKVPEEWDGHELRQLIADRFADRALFRKMTGWKLREYKNAVLCQNL